MSESYEYIVVGAGSSGCVVAGRLAQAGRRVLLLESGAAAERHPETLTASGYKQAFVNEALLYDRYSVAQPECADRRLFVGTGRGVGGSGAVNAMVYTRGEALDYDSWSLPGWGWAELAPAFVALERALGVGRRPPTRWTEACIAAAAGAGFRRKEDLNDGALAGYLGYEWMNQAAGERRHSYVAFARPEVGKRLTLVTEATVEKVLLDEARRAIGVRYTKEGRPVEVRAEREVVLAAGALETPKLLMLSGVGPAGELGRHRIPLLVERPAVGQNLMDHPNVQLFFRGRQPTDCDWAQLYGFYRVEPTSTLAPGQADSCFVFYSARSSLREAMMRLVPGMVLPEGLYRRARLRHGLRDGLGRLLGTTPLMRFVERVYGIVVILGKPKSRGVVRLAGADPRSLAEVDPRYFTAREDLETLVRGMRLARQIAAQRSLVEWGNLELSPGRWVESDAALGRFVRKNAMTTYHFAGTCRMGADEASVVDLDLRVRGLSGLRVADASVIPIVPVGAMNAPSMLVGWQAAERLLRTPG